MKYNNPPQQHYDEMSLLVGELLAVQKNYKLCILRTALQYLQSGEPDLKTFQCFLEEGLPVRLNIEDFVKEYSLVNLDDENLIQDDKTISILNEYEEEISIIVQKMELLKQKYTLQLKDEAQLKEEAWRFKYTMIWKIINIIKTKTNNSVKVTSEFSDDMHTKIAERLSEKMSDDYNNGLCDDELKKELESINFQDETVRNDSLNSLNKHLTQLLEKDNFPELKEEIVSEEEEPQNPFNFWEWLNNFKKWLYLTFRFKKS